MVTEGCKKAAYGCDDPAIPRFAAVRGSFLWRPCPIQRPQLCMAEHPSTSAAGCPPESCQCTSHITDKYFFEELTKSLGEDACYEWLRSLWSERGLSDARRSSTPNNSLNTPNSGSRRLPQEYIPPLSLLSPNKTNQRDIGSTGGKSKTSSATQGLRRPRGNLNGSASYTDDDLRLIFIGRTSSLPCLSKIGLLYTDAAHSVLQDQEVTDYISRCKSTTA